MRVDGDDWAGVVSILTLGAGLLALFLGFEWFWMVFVLGWVVLTPLAAMLADDDADEWDEFAKEAAADVISDDASDTAGSKQDALETLRDRYARGELSEVEFERKLERLLSTETLEDARRVVDEGGERAAGGRRERTPESDRESERGP